MCRCTKVIVVIVGVCAILIALVWLAPRPYPVLSAVPAGRFTNDDGGTGFWFAVTNKSPNTLFVNVRRLYPPPPPDPNMGYTWSIYTYMKPRSAISLVLYEPPDRTPWVAQVNYYRPPGRLEQRLRAIGARLRICSAEKPLTTAQTFEIKR
jgi:hypothetical protein